MTLPPHQSDKYLANQFVFFLTQKIKSIQDMFSTTTTNVTPPTDLSPVRSVRSQRMGYLRLSKIPYKIMSFTPSPHFSSQRLCGYLTPIYYKTCQSVFD